MSQPSNIPFDQCNTPPSIASLPSQAGSGSRKFTPHTVKATSVSSFSSLKPFEAEDKTYVRIWAKRVRDNSRICQSIDEFFETYVPGAKPTDELTSLRGPLRAWQIRVRFMLFIV
ncbi:hypothetical protein AMATHDRAFT_9952 [Amanita thiersii Skay4041]|uniref:Uncharacterized protein n=1 Tax=Amanita thiersii Skay4041 TaxID=703135 RepID=A0A2A9NBM0_9AGAR|nr:hypothetical protein AMATHDRAFT_9952 [Amanita thiersii Skay4041]